MKVGCKIFSSDTPQAVRDRDFADFIEIMAVPGQDIRPFADFDTEYVIHAPHSSYHVNLASSQHQATSIALVQEACRAADILNAGSIVVHTGRISNPLDSADIFRDSLNKLKDPRIVLENLTPYADDGAALSFDQATLSPFLTAPVSGVCLDFSHAVCTAHVFHRDYKDVIGGLATLNVRLFHICDSIAERGTDMHLPLHEGNLDLDYFKRLIRDSRCQQVTMETGLDAVKQLRDYEWLKS